MREIGIALFGLSVVLALFIVVPIAVREPVEESLAITVATSTPSDAFARVPMHAEAAIVYDLATKEILFEKNADAQLPLASLTKLLAVYAAVSALPNDASITIPPSVAELDYPRAFTIGQSMKLDDLSRLTLTASLNDGAAAIVEAVAKKRNLTQTETLAAAATTLRLTQTYALNGSGLDMNDTTSGAYGSAYDMARLAGALVARAPAIAKATAYHTAEATATDGQAFSVRNTDPIVHQIPHLLLSKTGFTDLAGGNLALVFDVGIGHPVAVIVLGSTKEARFTDGAALVAATLAHFAGVLSL